MNKNEKDYFVWHNQKTTDYRGRFASRAISVQLIIESFLAHYFVSEKMQPQFMELILHKKDFWLSQKIEIFEKILITFFPLLNKEYKPYLKRLETLRKRRNDFAHMEEDMSTETIAKHQNNRDNLHLRKIKNYEFSPVSFTIEELEIWDNEFGETIEKIAELLKRFISERSNK